MREETLLIVRLGSPADARRSQKRKTIVSAPQKMADQTVELSNSCKYAFTKLPQTCRLPFRFPVGLEPGKYHCEGLVHLILHLHILVGHSWIWSVPSYPLQSQKLETWTSFQYTLHPPKPPLQLFLAPRKRREKKEEGKRRLERGKRRWKTYISWTSSIGFLLCEGHMLASSPL